MRPDPAAQENFVAAFQKIARRISDSLSGAPEFTLPVKMFVAGGAAVHFYTGDRISKDIDAAFSHRIVLPADLEVSYRAPDGAAQLLYLDRQFNEKFALLHQNAYSESVPLELEGINRELLDVRLLAALDLAVSRISRFADQDKDDLTSLTKRGLIGSNALRARAEDAVKNYVGNLKELQTSIDLACNLVADVEKWMGRPPVKKPSSSAR